MEAARPRHGTYYGRYGTPTTAALEEAVAQLEGGDRAIVVGSGKTAITSMLLALLRTGDHLLVADTVYAPTRNFCTGTLARFGIETTFYDPRIGAGIAELIRPETRLVFTESPGSLTFEMQDMPAIAAAAHARGCLVAMDNTWASPLFCKPFRLGVDISVQAVTKYIGGHSDLMMGVVTCTEAAYDRLWRGMLEVATASAPDDCYLALRGLRTLAARLERHQRSALIVAEWLAGPARRCAGCSTLPCPATPATQSGSVISSAPQGFSASSSSPARSRRSPRCWTIMELFGMGYSWGGYESLLIPTRPETCRTATPWSADGVPMRIHVGLEDPGDLIRDLEAGFARLKAT